MSRVNGIGRFARGQVWARYVERKDGRCSVYVVRITGLGLKAILTDRWAHGGTTGLGYVGLDGYPRSGRRKFYHSVFRSEAETRQDVENNLEGYFGEFVLQPEGCDPADADTLVNAEGGPLVPPAPPEPTYNEPSAILQLQDRAIRSQVESILQMIDDRNHRARQEGAQEHELTWYRIKVRAAQIAAEAGE